MNELPANLRHRLILIRDLQRFGVDDRGVRRERASGKLTRVRRGCYMETDRWKELSHVERHLVRAHAVAANASIEPVFTHLTAAAFHGIPVIGALPATVHVTVEPGMTRRNQVDLVTHSLPLARDEVVRVDGVLASSVERTLVDLALTTTFQSAVASMDWALARGVERDALYAELERINPTKRMRAAEAVIDFADAASGSPGESLSRAAMHLLGCAAPQIQVPIRDQRGAIGTVDFYWPEIRLIGEFDGAAKYLRHEYLQEKSTGEVVYIEKVREDRMRATGRGFFRWGWAEASDLEQFARVLRSAGVPGLA